jgi:hypothetical protein
MHLIFVTQRQPPVFLYRALNYIIVTKSFSQLRDKFFDFVQTISSGHAGVWFTPASFIHARCLFTK